VEQGSSGVSSREYSPGTASFIPMLIWVDDVKSRCTCMYSLVACMFIVKPPNVSVGGVEEGVNMAKPIIV